METNPGKGKEANNHRVIRILVISMGGERRAVLEKLAEEFKGKIKLEFIAGIDGSKLRGQGPGWDGEGGDVCKLLGINTKEFSKRSRKIKAGDSKVLGAALAHMRAMHKAINEGFDLIAEDNIRFSKDSYNILKNALAETIDSDLAYYGFMSYPDSLKLIHTLATRKDKDGKLWGGGTHTMKMPNSSRNGKHVDLLWGMYGYRVSKSAFETVVKTLGDDPGKIFWKKRGRIEIRPLDRLLPRLIIASEGKCRLCRCPALVRMPPGHLASTIHQQYDIRYFQASCLQLSLTGRTWNDIYLTNKEREAVPAILAKNSPPKVPNLEVIFDEKGFLVIPFVDRNRNVSNQEGGPSKRRKKVLDIPMIEVDTYDEVKRAISVILTTSPLPSCPSTAVIEYTLQTMAKFAPALVSVPLIVTCDGTKVSSENKYRRGEITEDRAKAYKGYKDNLRTLSASQKGVWQNSKIVELTTRNGFGFAVKEGLKYVTTPLVLVLQHDRTFMRDFDLLAVCKAVSRREDMNYVLLQTSSTLNYSNLIPTLLNKNGNKAITSGAEVKHRVEFGSKFLPNVQWFDSTHICKTKWYKKFVFDRRKRLVSRGGFIECTFGQIQLADFREKGLKAVNYWGTWLLDDLQERCVGHVNGRRALTLAQKKDIENTSRAMKGEHLKKDESHESESDMRLVVQMRNESNNEKKN